MRDDTRQGSRGARGDQDRHLSMQHIDIEDRGAVTVALSLFEAGMDLPTRCTLFEVTVRPLSSRWIGGWPRKPRRSGPHRR
jgi:hypothetical protein